MAHRHWESSSELPLSDYSSLTSLSSLLRSPSAMKGCRRVIILFLITVDVEGTVNFDIEFRIFNRIRLRFSCTIFKAGFLFLAPFQCWNSDFWWSTRFRGDAAALGVALESFATGLTAFIVSKRAFLIFRFFSV